MANKKIRGITIEIGGNTINLEKSLKNVDSVSYKLNSELTQINRQLKFDPSSAVLLSQKQKVLAESIDNSRQKLKQLEDVQQDIERAYKKGDIDDGQYRAYQREVEMTMSQLKEYESQLHHTGEKQKEFDKKIANAKDTLKENKDILKQGAKNVAKWGLAVSAAAGGAGLAVMKYASDFEESFAKVSTLLDGSKEDLSKYKEDILNLSNELGVNSGEVSEAVYQALSASVSSDKAIDFTKKAFQLSKGGFTELSTAVDVLTTAMNAYGIGVDQASKLSDVLITTQNLGKTTVDQLAATMGRVIPTAAAYGVSLENVGTAYALLTKRGVNTANATTQIRSLLTSLTKEGGKTAQAGDYIRQATGKSFKELSESGKSLSDVLGILMNSARGNTDEFGKMFGNVNAKAAALALMKGGTEEYNSVLNTMKKSEGAAEKAFGKMADTSAHKVEKMKVQLENTAISIGEGLLPVANDFLDEVEKHLPEIQEMAKQLGEKIGNDAKWILNNGGTIVKIIKAVAIEAGGIYVAIKAYNATKIIVETVEAFKTLKTATEGAKTAQLALNTAQKANVIGAVVSGLIILGTTIWNICDATGVFSRKTSSLTEEQQKLIKAVNEEHDAMLEARDSRKKSVEGIESEYGYYERLYKELDRIIDKNGKVKEGEEDRAKFITDTLGKALGIEFEWNDKILTNYKDQKDAIKDLIQTKKNEAILGAYENDYNEAKKNSNDISKNFFDSKSNYENARKQRREWQNEIERLSPKIKQLQKLISSGNIQNGDYTAEDEQNLSLYSSRVDELKHLLRKNKKDFDELKNSYLNAFETYNDNLSIIKNYEKASEALLSGDSKKIKKWLNLLKNEFVSAGRDTSGAMKQTLIKQEEEAKQRYKELKKAHKDGVKGVTKEVVNEAKGFKERATKELTKFYKNLDEKNKSQSKEAAKSAKKAASEIGDSMTKVDTEKNKKKAKNRTKTVLVGIQKLLDKFGITSRKSGKKAGKEFGEGYAEGIESVKTAAVSAAEAGAKAALEATRKTQDSHSPAKKSRKLGRDNGEGYALGIEDKARRIAEAARKTTSGALADVGGSISRTISFVGDQNSNGASKTYNKSAVVNPTIQIGSVSIRNDNDIDMLSEKVSEKIAARIIREGGSMGE